MGVYIWLSKGIQFWVFQSGAIDFHFIHAWAGLSVPLAAGVAKQ
jgi:hypothetical protein